MSAATGGPGAVSAVADGYLRERARLDPEAADVLGEHDVLRIGDLSDATFEARVDLDRRTLAELSALGADAGGAAEQRLAAAMTERLGADVALDEVGFTRRLLAPLATPVHLVRQVFDGLPSTTPDERAVVERHLREVPRALAQYRDTLLAAAARGDVVARRQVLGVARQCDSWVASGFYAGVAGDDERLAGPARDAAAATASFADDLRERLLPLAPERDAVGRDVYATTSAAFLGAVVDLDELYAWGWEEIRRLQAEAAAIATELVGSPDVAAAVRSLDADPARRVPTGEPLRAWLQGRIDDVTDVVDGRWFAIPPRLRHVEARLVTAESGVMYYTPPDAGLTRPGRVWWTVPAGAADVTTWREVSTVHHEGVPGHHLQHAITYGLDDLHPWQRNLCHVHGYAEGWAHYAEQLASEIGLLDDPGERLGAVFAQLWRACRIVIDIGLHLELPIPPGTGVLDAGRWTPEVGVAALVSIAEVEPSTATFEVDRYLGWPGQALAFKVGARLWQQARADVAASLGDAFDLRTFHAEALGLGPMGLGPLQDQLARGQEIPS
ncbi:protein of unknown function DUF885 [Beutenbergia cavernae DSM 12333]|uniref:DUF885 domain-containing protein n=1 Tax=Beutenbergia cavernae (strain ATCC BAA-8 / DSM 12333 / CCUG 43141 / JCM 11478 / NBRC 16432 / NCIMB 13614 / HKI 0122) TaxID=471853 RepID=C5BVI1_BEUC1|nr:DUF885 domain-containing protein [Beutenbergia cavernae]ACQ78421.1 protein of unknown function DUF885 [Beutenbergia cavernae DSM 12333]